MTDEEYLAANDHISDAEIAQDIAETEAEIATMEQEANAWEQLPYTLNHKWDHLRAQARRSGIKKRQAFIEKLQRLQKLRSDQNTSSAEGPPDPSPTPWDHSTWGFYCDACRLFFNLLRDGHVVTHEDNTHHYEHKKCGKRARYIGYDHTI